MEIISIVTEGALAHKDSTGSESVLKAGEVQVMTAGSGVMHSEYNHSSTKPAKFFQIWIQPKTQGLPPNYSQKKFSDGTHPNTFVALACGDSACKALSINQDAAVSIGNFEAGKKKSVSLQNGKGLFVFVVEGKVKCAGIVLLTRDSINLSATSKINFEFLEKSRVIIIEVPIE
jgi:redox-sensitive bicupin YhaK (pirin superfamily)